MAIKQKYAWIGKGKIRPIRQDELLAELFAERNFPLTMLSRPDYSFEEGGHDPTLIPDFSSALEKVLGKRHSGEKVIIFGDYDADGITSSAILYETFMKADIKAEVILPHREDDGYGLTVAAVEKIPSSVKLLIAVDNGTSAFQAIDKARERGIDVIVIDHHTVQDKLPDALVVNPYRTDSRYPFRSLCAAGLAFKFSQALLEKIGRADEAKWLLDLAAIGTLADRVPLVDENRLLARFGLKVISATKRVGLLALIYQSGAHPGKCDAETLSYKIIPRLNAAGRMSHPMLAFDLLTAQNAYEAEKSALILNSLNEERKSVTEDAVEEIREKIIRSVPLPDFVCVSGDWPVGVLGILAGKLAEDLARPAAVINVGAEKCVGSARGANGASIVDILSGLKETFIKFGGHHEAGGFSFAVGNLKKVEKYFSGLSFEKKAVAPVLRYDAILNPAWLNLSLLESLSILEPHGESNERPLFVLENSRVAEAKRIGSQGDHLRLKIIPENGNGAVYSAISFRFGNNPLPAPGEKIDMLAELRVNEYGREKTVDLHLKDMRSAQ